MTRDFYRHLDAFAAFEEFTHAERYQPLPADWLVVVTDIRNSTRAIENGLYKEVNLIGAASITQAMIVLESQDIPFVFGGDGASICIPAGAADRVSGQLALLQKLALDNFALELRVALVPLADIRQLGSDVLVAKLEITAGKYIALFRGGGLAMADRLAKEQYARYAIPASDRSLDSLTGLSCRWSPLPSRQGRMVSLLVTARGGQAMAVYRDLLSRFRAIMGREIAAANPVLDNLHRYKTVVQAVRDEARYHRRWFSVSFLARLLDIVLAVLIFRHGLNPVPRAFNARSYLDALAGHSDYRKFDDTLRLIMDCSHRELAGLQALLEEGYRAGYLYYGLHASDEALMTCFVETTSQGGHLHFIDGGDGGLAMAARQMKRQMGQN